MAGLLLIVAPSVSTSLFAEGVHRPDEIGALARSAFRIIGAILVPGLVSIFILGGTCWLPSVRLMPITPADCCG